MKAWYLKLKKKDYKVIEYPEHLQFIQISSDDEGAPDAESTRIDSQVQTLNPI